MLNPSIQQIILLLFAATLLLCTTGASQTGLSPADTSLASEITNQVSTIEWLGPLAPIAISPFFGITCLAFLSQMDFVPGNSFVSQNPVLQNPTVLWVFLALTVLTSLPRLTKVSKPLAQALDQVEAYSGIITLLILRFAVSVPEDSQDVVALQMGFFGFVSLTDAWNLPFDLLMAGAAILNVIVINSVKFFFEVLVWLVPVPFVDALLETANKSLCAALMALYAYSPLLATIVNLAVFAVCLLAFFWIRRRIVYMRTLFCDPIMARLNAKFRTPSGELVVFPKTELGPFPAKAKLILRHSEQGWSLTHHRFPMSSRVLQLSRDEWDLRLRTGLLINHLELTGATHNQLLFSQRFANHMPELANQLEFRIAAPADRPDTALGTT